MQAITIDVYATRPQLQEMPKLILLVEDDPTTAQLFMHILSEETPYPAYWATNGRPHGTLLSR